jgi:hypothetical protein
MFTKTWEKYLPVIVLLMKRSDKNEQVLDMNHTDFERAAAGKKIKFSFREIHLKNGRPDSHEKLSVLAGDLITLIQANEKAKWITPGQSFEFSMNTNFQLKIKNITPAVVE